VPGTQQREEQVQRRTDSCRGNKRCGPSCPGDRANQVESILDLESPCGGLRDGVVAVMQLYAVANREDRGDSDTRCGAQHNGPIPERAESRAEAQANERGGEHDGRRDAVEDVSESGAALRQARQFPVHMVEKARQHEQPAGPACGAARARGEEDRRGETRDEAACGDGIRRDRQGPERLDDQRGKTFVEGFTNHCPDPVSVRLRRPSSCGSSRILPAPIDRARNEGGISTMVHVRAGACRTVH